MEDSLDWFETWYQSIVDFKPSSTRQIADRELLLAEALDRSDIFDRYSNPRHCTASAMIVGVRGLILHKHKKLKVWIQPGGHIDFGESPWQSSIREAEEETGLSVSHPAEGPTLLHISCHLAGAHFHLDSQYLLISDDQDPNPPEGESQEIGWFELDDARRIADRSMAEVLGVLSKLDLSSYLN